MDTPRSGGEDWQISDGAAFVTGDETNLATITPTSVLDDDSASALAARDNDNYLSGSDIFFKLGDVVNMDDDDNDEFVVIEFNAVVENHQANQENRRLNNNMQVNIDGENAVGGRSDSVQIRIAEPDVEVEKTLLVAPDDAGDQAVYQLVVENQASGAGASAGFDIDLLDDLDALMPPGTLTIDDITFDASAAPGAVVNDLTVGNQVQFSIDQLDPGESVTIVITTTVNPGVGVGQSIDNTTSLTYSSLPGDGSEPNATGSVVPGAPGSATGERTGDDGLGGLNDYVSESSVAHNLLAPGIDKLDLSDTTYTIGEVVTYDLLVTIPEGNTSNLIVADQIPDGLDFLNFEVITEAGLSGGVLAADFAGALNPSPVLTDFGGSGGDIELEFGNIVNPSDSDDANNQFVVRIQMQVVNEIDNQAGDVLTNTASLRYDNPDSGPTTVEDPTPVDIEIVEPVLGMEKLIVSSGGMSTDGGDEIRYQVTIENTAAVGSSADAFEALFVDMLPTDMMVSALNVVSGPSGVSSADFSISDAGGGTNNLIESSPFDLALGETLVLEYTAIISTDVQAADVLTNSAGIAWSSLDGDVNPGASDGERDGSGLGLLDDGSLNDYRVVSEQSVVIASPTLDKSIIDTSLPATGTTQFGAGEDLAIGEVVTFLLVIDIPEISVPTLELTDMLPTSGSQDHFSLLSVEYMAGLSDQNLVYTEGFAPTIVLSDSNASGGDDRISATFTNLVNNVDSTTTSRTNQIVFEVVARVENISVNLSGEAIANEAALDFGSGTVTDSVDMDIVEPAVTLDKSILSPSPLVDLDAGDTVQYQVVINNSSADGSSADAFDLLFADTVDAGLLITSIDSVTVVGGSISSPAVNIIGGGTGLQAGDGIDTFDLPLDEQIIVTYTATVSQSVEPGQMLSNAAHIEWSSLDGTSPDERGPADGFVADDATTVDVATITNFDKSVFSTSIDETGESAFTPGIDDVAIGEVVTFRLVAEIPELSVDRLVISDSLPVLGGVLSLQDARLVTAASDSNMRSDGSTTLAPTITTSDASGDGLDDTVQFEFLNFENLVDASVTERTNLLIIEIDALVEDLPANSAGDLLTNEATLEFTDVNDIVHTFKRRRIGRDRRAKTRNFQVLCCFVRERGRHCHLRSGGQPYRDINWPPRLTSLLTICC